ncbi:hypothetical protein L1D32_05115 [Shewanella insulae]|uniref:hypothetical protein n=1 Tax=Shewanella insulae TaxID=2681496 RepID=UPI001EFE60ED|nr:hypothetical protein [Shewanella insulae]MCG9737530.1 hypothetical protein [Shewanella insulae]
MNLSSIIVKFSYLYIPVLAFFYKYFVGNQYTKYFFDLIFLCAVFFVFLLLLSRGKTSRSIPLTSVFFIGVGLLLSILINHFYNLLFYNGQSGFYFAPFIMALKLPLYFLVCSILCLFSKPLELKKFVVYSRFFSICIILDFFIRLALSGYVVRPSILSETNYDSLMVLVGLCALFNVEKSKTFIWDYLLFGFVMLLTQSKTSIGCFALMSLYQFSDKRYFRYMLPLLIFFIISAPVIISRLSVLPSLDKLDRFLMWFSYFELLKESSLHNILFGFAPGYYLRLEDKYLWFFIEHLSERAGAVGLHSFNFHSMWLRIALDYGLFFLAFIFSALSLCFYRYEKLRVFILMVFLQGFTMGVFFLSVNVFVLFFYIKSQLDYGSERY